jgi:hypothetical protein
MGASCDPMADVFISYSSQDSHIAQRLYTVLTTVGIQTFLAEISLQPGTRWKPQILNNLRQSKWFLFLATPNSCNSDAVKHEIGAALVLNKNLVPILVHVSPQDLPNWVKDHQAVDSTNPEQFQKFLTSLGSHIRSDKAKTVAVVIGLVLFFGLLLSED